MRNHTPKYPWSFSQDQAPYCRNVTVAGRRTSVRMEPLVWQSLAEIAEDQGSTINELCTLIDRRRGPMGLTASIRLFILHYYRLSIATLKGDLHDTDSLANDGVVPPGFSDPGTTDLVSGPATIDRVLDIFNRVDSNEDPVEEGSAGEDAAPEDGAREDDAREENMGEPASGVITVRTNTHAA